MWVKDSKLKRENKNKNKNSKINFTMKFRNSDPTESLTAYWNFVVLKARKIKEIFKQFIDNNIYIYI